MTITQLNNQIMLARNKMKTNDYITYEGAGKPKKKIEFTATTDTVAC